MIAHHPEPLAALIRREELQLQVWVRVMDVLLPPTRQPVSTPKPEVRRG